MEQPLLAASLRSRHDYELIRSYIDMRLATYSKPFQIVMAKVGDYYKRDAEAGHVDTSILMAQIAESIRNEKHVQRFIEFINESLATATSNENIRAIILIAKQQEVGDKLAQALAMDAGAKVDDLLVELTRLRAMSSLDDLEEEGLEFFHDVDLSDLITREFNPEQLIQVYPKSLNDHLDGGAKKGHHLLAFGPVEIGKSALSINAVCGFARQGKKSLYYINEDRPQDIIMRMVSNMSGMSKYQIQSDPRKAQHLANESGFRNIIVVNCSPGTPQQVEDGIDEHEPDCVAMDQLRNMKVNAENRTNQLEKAATAMRNIGKKKDVLVWSVTQGSDSCRNKLILDTGDVDSSNVGIPAQADVMIGISMDAAMEAEGVRMLSLPKNKISGNHDAFPVKINTQLSRLTSV